MLNNFDNVTFDAYKYMTALSDDMPVGCTVVNVEDVYRVLYVKLKLNVGDADNFATNFATAVSSLDSDTAVYFLKDYSDNKNEIKERVRNCREILNNFHSVTFDDFKYIMTLSDDMPGGCKGGNGGARVAGQWMAVVAAGIVLILNKV